MNTNLKWPPTAQCLAVIEENIHKSIKKYLIMIIIGGILSYSHILIYLCRWQRTSISRLLQYGTHKHHEHAILVEILMIIIQFSFF